MPAVATHYLFGQAVYRELVRKNRKDIIAMIRKNKKDYNIGLQGPDPFFYYHPTRANEVTKMANELHKKPGSEFFERAAVRIQEAQDLRAFTYMLGVVVHYALDSEAHPLVNQYGKDSVGHIKIETELDREILLREILERDAKNRKEKYIEKNKGRFGFRNPFAKKNELAPFEPRFYSPKPSVRPEKIRRDKLIGYEKGIEASIAIFYPSLTQRQIQKSLDSFIHYNRLLYSPSGANMIVLNQLEKVIKKNGLYSALALTAQRHKDYVEYARKLVPVYDYTVETAADLVISFYDATAYHSGLSKRFELPFD